MIALLLLSITIHQSTDTLYMDGQVSCEISIDHPGTRPDLTEFVDQVKKRELSSFSIASVESKPGDKTSTLSFVLFPTRLGECIFAPGVLSFSQTGDRVLLPAMQATCLASGLHALTPASLLPLYPEKKIALSPENRLRLLSRDVLKKSQDEIQSRLEAFSDGWSFVVIALIAVALSCIGLWVLVECELKGRARRWFLPTKDPSSDLLFRVHDEQSSMDDRLEALCALFKLRISQKIGMPCSFYAFEELGALIETTDLPEKESLTSLCRQMQAKMQTVLFAHAPASSSLVAEGLELVARV